MPRVLSLVASFSRKAKSSDSKEGIFHKPPMFSTWIYIHRRSNINPETQTTIFTFWTHLPIKLKPFDLTIFSHFHFPPSQQSERLPHDQNFIKVEMEKSDVELKHLGFARVVALNVAVCVSYLYGYAKQNSGPLKSTVATVENAVTTIVRPVYERFKGLPDDFLVFLDKKVDEVSTKFDELAPPVAKKIVNKAGDVVKKGSQVAQYLVLEALVSGPFATISHAASLSKNIVVAQLAVVWYGLNRYPILHALGEMAIPTVAYWSNKYNKFIAKLDTRGYHIFSYFPSVPVEDVVKAYKQVEAATAKKDDGVVSSETD